MSTRRKAARAEHHAPRMSAGKGGIPGPLVSRSHSAWSAPEAVAEILGDLLEPEDVALLARAPGVVELLRHRALGRWAAANGYADESGAADYHRLAPLLQQDRP